MWPRRGSISLGAARPHRNHGPAWHLPRYEVVIDVENHDCPCCGGALHAISELRTELDITRPSFACASRVGPAMPAAAAKGPW